MFNFNVDLKETEIVLGDQIEYQNYEAIRLTGYPCVYVQATEVDNNEIFGESTERYFFTNKGFEMFYSDDEDSVYSGSELFGGFNMMPQFNKKIFIAVKEFTDLEIEPIEGDLIFDSNYDIVFEITKVDPLTETLTGNKINNRRMAYQLYLKHYSPNYEDNFENILEFDDEVDNFTDDDLSALNEDLESAINDLGIIDTASRNNPFGGFDD